MFGLHEHGDDPDWQGWWGDEPPFRVPVFVLTTTPRPPIEMANGTSFRFLDATPEEALARASAVAAGGDIRIGGGATTARAFLDAGLVDELPVAVVPLILGRGVRKWSTLASRLRRTDRGGGW